MTNLELEDDEIKSIIEILRFSLTSCPIESVSNEVKIEYDSIPNLISKLEKTIEQV